MFSGETMALILGRIFKVNLRRSGDPRSLRARFRE